MFRPPTHAPHPSPMPPVPHQHLMGHNPIPSHGPTVSYPLTSPTHQTKGKEKDKKGKDDKPKDIRDMIEIDLSQIEDEQIRKIFDDLFTRIERKQQDIAGLRRLKMLYITEGKEAFDQDDLRDIDGELEVQEKRLLNYEEKLRVQVKMFNSTILRLHQILHIRKTILDKADEETNVLQRNPVLLEKIAEKQVKLEQILEDTKSQLSKCLFDSDDEADAKDDAKKWYDEDSEIDRRSRSRERKTSLDRLAERGGQGEDTGMFGGTTRHERSRDRSNETPEERRARHERRRERHRLRKERQRERHEARRSREMRV